MDMKNKYVQVQDCYGVFEFEGIYLGNDDVKFGNHRFYLTKVTRSNRPISKVDTKIVELPKQRYTIFYIRNLTEAEKVLYV